MSSLSWPGRPPMAATTEHSSGRSWREAWAGETLAGDASCVYCCQVSLLQTVSSSPRGAASRVPSPPSTSPQTSSTSSPLGPSSTQTQPRASLFQAAPHCPPKPLGCQSPNSPLRSFQPPLLSWSPGSSSPIFILTDT